MRILRLFKGVAFFFGQGAVAFWKIVARRSVVPVGASKVSHDRGLRILICISMPADAAFGFVLNIITARYVPLLSSAVVVIGILLFLFPLVVAAELQVTPHFVTTEGVTVRDGRREFFIPSEWISGATWAPRDVASLKDQPEVAVLAGGADIRLDFDAPRTLPILKLGPVRHVWFSADDSRSAELIRDLCLRRRSTPPPP